MKLTLGGSILVVSLICGAAFSPEAIGQVTRTRTTSGGRQGTTEWTRGNGSATRTRTTSGGHQGTTEWTTTGDGSATRTRTTSGGHQVTTDWTIQE